MGTEKPVFLHKIILAKPKCVVIYESVKLECHKEFELLVSGNKVIKCKAG